MLTFLNFSWTGRLVSERFTVRTRSGVTLIEVLVLISIVGILAALCLWGVQGSSEAARRAQCSNNLRQLALAAQTYHSALGSYPGGQYLHPFSKAAFSGRQVNNASWLVMLLPQMGQQALYNEVNFSFMWGTTRRGGGWKSFGNQNVTVRETVLGLFACPADLSPRTDRTNADEIANALAAGTSYLGNLGSNCLGGKEFPCAPPELGDEPDDPRGGNGVIWRKGSATTNEITDGLATTFLAGEQIMAISDWNAWVHANESTGSTAMPLNYRPRLPNVGASRDIYWFWTYSFRSQHPGGANFSFCDGSVRFVKDSVNFSIYQALSTRNGGEAFKAGSY